MRVKKRENIGLKLRCVEIKFRVSIELNRRAVSHQSPQAILEAFIHEFDTTDGKYISCKLLEADDRKSASREQL